MKRTGFARPAYERPPVVVTPLARPAVYAPAVACAPIPKPEPVRPGKRTPTVAEREWMDAITQIGCIACRIDGWHGSVGAVHHLLRGGRRMGHMYTICLCDPGHHQGGAARGMVSRHPWKRRFEARYGTEPELLDMTRELVEQRKALMERGMLETKR